MAIGALTIPMSRGRSELVPLYAGGAIAVAVVLVVAMVTSLTSKLGGRLAKLLGAEQLTSARLPTKTVLRAAACWALRSCSACVELAVLLYLLDLPFTFSDVCFLLGALSAAGFIGGAIPQGLGVQEAATVGVFEILHYPGAAAVAFALARRGRMLLLSVVGVGLHLTFGRVAPVTDQVAEPPQGWPHVVADARAVQDAAARYGVGRRRERGLAGIADLVSTLACLWLWVSPTDLGVATLATALFPVLERLAQLGLGSRRCGSRRQTMRTQSSLCGSMSRRRSRCSRSSSRSRRYRTGGFTTRSSARSCDRVRGEARSRRRAPHSRRDASPRAAVRDAVEDPGSRRCSPTPPRRW